MVCTFLLIRSTQMTINTITVSNLAPRHLKTFRMSQAAKKSEEKLLYSHATILPAPGKFTPNYCLPLIYIKPEFQPPPSFAKTLGLIIASEGGG